MEMEMENDPPSSWLLGPAPSPWLVKEDPKPMNIFTTF